MMAVLNDVVINTDVGIVVKEVDIFSIFISVVKEVGTVDSLITVDTIEDKGNVDIIKLLILKPVALILLLQASVTVNKFKIYLLLYYIFYLIKNIFHKFRKILKIHF
jgi:hypothetical protein